MTSESPSRNPEKLYPDHYEFGESKPANEGGVKIEHSEGFMPVNVTIIRHHLTPYKELQDRSFHFHPSTSELNANTLDLTEEGIAGMRVVAEDLASRIDSEKEVVYAVTSPQYRAQSSLLLLTNELHERGIELVNNLATQDTKHTVLPSLRQSTFKDPNDPIVGTQPWIEADKVWKGEDTETRRRMPPHLAHAEIAKVLGHELADILKENHTQTFERFMRTLRHVSNIGRYLSAETRKSLEGKKLRVVVLTHEELPSAFLQHAFDAKENLKNGQTLEIEAESFMEDGKETVFDTRLYPLRSSDSFSVPLSSEFSGVQARRVSITFKK